MVNLKHRVMDQTRRQINRRLRIEICCVTGIHNHKSPGDRNFNTVDVIMRDRPAKNDKYRFRTDIIVPPNYLGGHCMGDTRSPRVGDVVVVLFYADREGYVLGPAWSWAEYPVCRPTPYDIAKKGGQWMKPYQDEWSDFPEEPYPEIKKPYCDRWFHGPVKGTTGRGRDWARVYDYCQEGDATPDCSVCKTIDSIGRDKNSWDKVYSHETESCEAPSKRRELHVPSGSYLRFDSETGQSVEYSEGCGHIRLGNATCEGAKKGHLNFNPQGSIDIHSKHEEAPIASEQAGTRVIVVAPEDSSVEYAVEAKDFESGAYIRIMKSGEIIIHSPTKITLDAPLVEETHDNLTSGDNTIVGFCSHGGCSCP
jgi:hypothetical protein